MTFFAVTLACGWRAKGREFAKSIGQLAKTDRIDARVLALYGERVQPPLRELPDEQSQALRALSVRREQLIEMVVMEQNRLEHLMLAAQAYRESKLDQKLRSRAGAIGVMQIKPSTAAQSPINIRGVNKLDRDIEAGTKFMRFIETQYFKSEALDKVTESLFATASYNAGPVKIQRLRMEAAERIHSQPVVQ